MKFGLHHPNYGFDCVNQNASRITDNLKKLATSAEKLGFDSFWIMDHLHQTLFLVRSSEPIFEKLVYFVSIGRNNFKNTIVYPYDNSINRQPSLSKNGLYTKCSD
ncbi:MAG TPA: hypothetical protein VH500_01485 [Nitrososphaeraceae archaeon]